MTLLPQNTTSINRVSVYEIIFGAVLSPILFIFYCSILWTLLINRRTFYNPYYKLTVGLGFCHLAMLTRYFYTFWVAYASDYILGPIFDSIMATMAWSVGWHSVITYHAIICVNRFVAIMLYDRYTSIFCQKTTKLLALVAYFSGLLTVSPMLIHHTFHYNLTQKFNLLIPDDQAAQVWFTFDVVFAVSAGITVISLYLTAIIYSKYKLRHLQQKKINRTSGSIAISAVSVRSKDGVAINSTIKTIRSALFYTKVYSSNCQPSSSAHSRFSQMNRLKSRRRAFVKEVKLMSEGFLVALTLVGQEVTFYVGGAPGLTLAVMLLHAGMSPFIYLALDAKLRKHFRSQSVWFGKCGSMVGRRPTSTTSYDYELRIQCEAEMATNVSRQQLRMPDEAVILQVTSRQQEITNDQDRIVQF